MAALFPQTEVEGMLVIPTCQRSAMDMVQTGERVDEEKDRLLERVGGGCVVWWVEFSSGSGVSLCSCAE